MVKLPRQAVRDVANPLRMLLLSVAVVWLGCSMSHASEPALPEPTLPEPTLPEPAAPGLVVPEPVAGEPVPPSPMAEPTVAPTVSSIEKLWQERPLGSVKASIQPTVGDLPPNVASPRLADAGVFHQSFGDSRPWMLASYEWEAPATRHLPLFFEEPNLERLGYTNRCYLRSRGTGPRTAECLQPLVSGVHFFGSIPFVPYMWGYQSACEPVYTLGVDRPGSPVCYRKHHIPLSLRGSLYEAGFITGLVFLIP